MAGGLSVDDVRTIVDQSVAQAQKTRAQVRLPYGLTASFIIAVTDQSREILAEFRMVDSLFDAVDVVPSKARNAYYFSTREGYEVLRQLRGRGALRRLPLGARSSGRTGLGPHEPHHRLRRPAPLPPGHRRLPARDPGPWFDLFVYDTLNPCTEGPGPSRGGNRSFVNQNGITWFAGSAPLYQERPARGRHRRVSGDGVEQNDLVTAAGAVGFEPPDRRCGWTTASSAPATARCAFPGSSSRATPSNREAARGSRCRASPSVLAARPWPTSSSS